MLSRFNYGKLLLNSSLFIQNSVWSLMFKYFVQAFSLICYCFTDCENLDLCVCTFVFPFFALWEDANDETKSAKSTHDKNLEAAVICSLMVDNENIWIPEPFFCNVICKAIRWAQYLIQVYQIDNTIQDN